MQPSLANAMPDDLELHPNPTPSGNPRGQISSFPAFDSRRPADFDGLPKVVPGELALPYEPRPHLRFNPIKRQASATAQNAQMIPVQVIFIYELRPPLFISCVEFSGEPGRFVFPAQDGSLY